MKRSLALRRETLAPLTDGELVSIAGGQYTEGGLSCLNACTIVNIDTSRICDLTDRCATTNCPTLLC